MTLPGFIFREVAMHNPGAMGRVECVGDLNGSLEGLIEWQGAFRQPLRERVAFQVLHDEEYDCSVSPD